MLKSAHDAAMDLYLDVNRMANPYVRKDSETDQGQTNHCDDVPEREIGWTWWSRMSLFKQTWLECIDRMRPEDVPSDTALRDTLHSKIKESPALKLELTVHYDMLTYDDAKRSYKTLLHIMDRCIWRQREQKMLKQTQAGLQQMIQGKDLLSAMAAKAKGTEAATPAPEKPTKPPKHEDAAPVLPQSTAKAHAKQKLAKGKASGRPWYVSRSATNNVKKSIRRARREGKPKAKAKAEAKAKADRGDRIVKVNVKDRFEIDNRMNELGFSMPRARLKAQMMSDMVQDGKPGDRHVYIRVPGSNRVREIIFHDGEDELHEYDIGPEESKKVKKFSIVTVQPTWIRSKIKFLMDTGCVITEPINAYVLDDTPSVLSLGKRCMKQGYGFVWPPGDNPFMINPDGKRISLFVNGDIPYVRAGSQKSVAHDDEMAATIKSILDQVKEEDSEKALNAVAATVDATPGEEEDPDDFAEGYSPDEIPDEVPVEDVAADEAGRPPDPPDGEDEQEREDDDEREIEVEGEGAPARKAKMKHYRTVRGAFKRELRSWGDLITFDFLDMRRAADMGIGNDDEAREVLVVRDVATRVIAAIPTPSRYTEDVVEALKRLIGRRKVKLAYSDAAPEFDAAMAQLRTSKGMVIQRGKGLTDNRRLQGKEIKDKDDVDRPFHGGNDDDDDDEPVQLPLLRYLYVALGAGGHDIFRVPCAK
ncbi:unnamed protein product [Symbiodinium sp. KB8]|nr:unnamed protein product [Symbiodinium sp. KB8]